MAMLSKDIKFGIIFCVLLFVSLFPALGPRGMMSMDGDTWEIPRPKFRATKYLSINGSLWSSKEEWNVGNCNDAYNKVAMHFSNDRQCAPSTGTFIVRNVIPKDELAKLKSLVTSLPLDISRLCGASLIQPDECKGWVDDTTFPKTAERLNTILNRLKRDESAMVGAPAKMNGFEFIKMSRWGYHNNESCVFSAIATTVRPYMTGCLQETSCEDDSIKPCWQTCLANAVVNVAPREIILAALQAEAKGSTPPECKLPYALFRNGRTTYNMGRRSEFDFGFRVLKDFTGKPYYGTFFNVFRAWLAKTFIEVPSLYQGFHEWHTDGSSGNDHRFHKFFLMIAKGDESHPVVAETTNVKVIPPEVLYSATCTDKKLDGSERFLKFSEVTEKLNGMIQAPITSPEAKLRAFDVGQPPNWHAFEALSCSFPMMPGDALFFREDVWHRTQDMTQDRIAMIIDVDRNRDLKVPIY